MYHYRDSIKREIDFVLESEQNHIIGIEVKSGSAITPSQFKHLEWFAQNIAKNKTFTGIVLYSGQHIIPFGKNYWAVPINALWHA